MNNPDLPTCDDGRVDTTVLTDWIVDQVHAALPASGTLLARSAASAAAPNSRGLAMIHRHLRDHPDALTSGQPEIPPVMTKLIRALADAGTGAVLPVCSRCRRLRPVVTRDESGPVCQACRARDPARREACRVCGQAARIVSRHADGTGMCRRCYQAQRAPERCCLCGHDRVPVARTSEGPVCERCYQTPAQRCDACGRIRPLKTHRIGDQLALCSGCYRGKPAACTGCGQNRPTKLCTVRNGEPTCASCWPRPQRTCARCAQVKPILTRWPIGDVCAACYAWVRKHPTSCAHCRAVRPLIGTDSVDISFATVVGPPRCQSWDHRQQVLHRENMFQICRADRSWRQRPDVRYCR